MQLFKWHKALSSAARSSTLPSYSALEISKKLTSTPLRSFGFFNWGDDSKPKEQSKPDIPVETPAQEPTGDKYLVFPVKHVIFPQASYFTRISPSQYDVLDKLRVSYVAAFLAKDTMADEPESTSNTISITKDSSVVVENSGDSSTQGTMTRLILVLNSCSYVLLREANIDTSR